MYAVWPFSIFVTIFIHRITEDFVPPADYELGTQKIHCKNRFAVSESYFIDKRQY